MRKAIFTLSALSLLAASFMTNAADVKASDTVKKPVSTWTCEDFLVLDEVSRPSAIIFASGLANNPNEAMFDIVDTEKVIPYIIGECAAMPKASFMDKLKQGWMNLKKAM